MQLMKELNYMLTNHNILFKSITFYSLIYLITLLLFIFQHYLKYILMHYFHFHVDDKEGECDANGVNGIWPRWVSPSNRLNV